MDKEKTGQLITLLRKEKGLTQKQLADALNVTDKAVSKWERGLSFPDISMLEPISELLDISILEIILTRQENGSLMLNDDKVKEKIQTLINHANNTRVESLLKKLVADKQILDMVAGYVATLDSKKINSLPVSIAKFAVSTFKRENAEIYKDNEDFLILVLQQGNFKQKREVVRLMKAKINAETDLVMVVNVLDKLQTEDQNMLKTLVGELEGLKDSDTVSEDDKANVAALAVKLSVNIKKTGLIDKVFGKKKPIIRLKPLK